MNVIEMLKKEEGFVGHVYNDTRGIPTLGYGTKMPITAEEGELLLEYRLNKLKQEVQVELAYLQIDDEAWDILYLMAYQIGVRGLLKFKKMIKALEVEDYVEAANQMLNSKWAKQTPQRASRMAQIMGII